jgi:hypothetical protein
LPASKWRTRRASSWKRLGQPWYTKARLLISTRSPLRSHNGKRAGRATNKQRRFRSIAFRLSTRAGFCK